MNRNDTQHATIYIAFLVVGAFLINGNRLQYEWFGNLTFQSQQVSRPQQNTQQIPYQAPQQPQSIPNPPPPQFPSVQNPPPATAQPNFWPYNKQPNDLVTVPNQVATSTGTIDNYLQPGEDREITFEPFWLFTFQDPPSSIEIAINDGDGFLSLYEYQRKVVQAQQAGDNSWLPRRRIMRMRLNSTLSDAVPYRIVVWKQNGRGQ